MMFEEDIIFATAVADDLEFTSDDIFFGDELLSHSAHYFPHHDKGVIIWDVL